GDNCLCPMNNIYLENKKIIADFLTACGRDYEFPAGGSIRFPMPTEVHIVRVLSDETLADSKKIALLDESVISYDWYSVIILAIRLAIAGVRTKSANDYVTGIIPLVASAPKVDYRDSLRAFAIFEECGTRLSLSFETEI